MRYFYNSRIIVVNYRDGEAAVPLHSDNDGHRWPAREQKVQQPLEASEPRRML
jgi:hypothetical protein